MIIVQLTHRLERGLVVLFWCVICANTAAGHENIYLSDFESFGIEESDFNKMPILAFYQMDSKTLFLAAEAERDNSMSMEQRLINNRWLLDHSDQSYSGPDALRHYLRLFLIQSWKAERAKKEKEGNIYSMLTPPKEPSQFRDISNYRLKLSNDKVKLRFRYRFH